MVFTKGPFNDLSLSKYLANKAYTSRVEITSPLDVTIPNLSASASKAIQISAFSLTTSFF